MYHIPLELKTNCAAPSQTTYYIYILYILYIYFTYYVYILHIMCIYIYIIRIMCIYILHIIYIFNILYIYIYISFPPPESMSLPASLIAGELGHSPCKHWGHLRRASGTGDGVAIWWWDFTMENPSENHGEIPLGIPPNHTIPWFFWKTSKWKKCISLQCEVKRCSKIQKP